MKVGGYTHTAIKLAAKLEKELGIKRITPIIHRVRAGHWQRSLGAWSWYIFTEDGLQFGSSDNVATILKAKSLKHLQSNHSEIYAAS